MTLLRVRDLTAGYGQAVVLRDLSIDLGERELVVVLGANGAGKSTLMAALIGWLHPRSGTIRLDGEELAGLPPWRRVGRGLALVPETGRVFGQLTVEENLRVVRPSPRGLARALELFPVLAERRHQPARTLSGGERQMLALARAIVTEPRVLLVDEASTGLMPVLVDRLFQTLRQLCDDGLPILLVEQNTRALAVADRAYIMATGRVVKQGRPEELAADPDVRRAYLGG
ncbi:MAG TPA: ABC transporter ATP-binding protein [Bacillota bacterium]